MTPDEKLSLLYDYEDVEIFPKLGKAELNNILTFSKDSDDFIRSQAASLLVNYHTKDSRKRLLELAFDKEAFVRCEAYDSLCIFTDRITEMILKNAILYEKNYLACFYAISSWTDIVEKQKQNKRKNYRFIRKMEKSQRIRSSAHCQMACCAAMYRLGDKKVIKKIVTFLNSKNYQVRCATVNQLSELVDAKSKSYIVCALKQQYKKEETIAVKSSIETALRGI